MWKGRVIIIIIIIIITFLIGVAALKKTIQAAAIKERLLIQFSLGWSAFGMSNNYFFKFSRLCGGGTLSVGYIWLSFKETIIIMATSEIKTFRYSKEVYLDTKGNLIVPLR